MTEEVLATALEALAAGLCPIPAAQDGTKRPMGRWAEFHERRPDEAEVRAWFSNGQQGVGVVTGSISKDLELFEFEGQAVTDRIHQDFYIACVAAGLGDLLDRIIAGYAEHTPAGGLHLLYYCPGGVGGPVKLARRPATVEELTAKPEERFKLLIETKGQHGFCIIAPSGGPTHPSGGMWRLASGSLRTIATITVEEREALFAVARQFDRSAAPATPPPPMQGERRAGAGGDSLPSEEFMAANTCGQVLERAGFTAVRAHGGGMLYTRPGKNPRDGHSAIVRHQHQRTGDERAALYSTSIDAPSEFMSPGADGQERALNAWQLHVALNHAGDFSEAARQWRHEHPRPSGDDLSWIHQPRTATEPPHGPQDAPNGDRSTNGATPPPEGEEGPPPRLRRWSAAELATANLDVQWLVTGLLTQPTYGMAAGQLKTLKTHVTALLAVSIASGRPYLGHFTVPEARPVVIYVGEGGRIPYTRLLKRACQAMGVDLADLPIHVVFDVAPVTSDIFRDTLTADLAEIGPAMALLDPWYAYHGAGTDAKNLFEEGALLSALHARCADGGANLMIVNHFNQTGTGNDLKRITMAGGGEWVDSWMLLTHRVEPDVNKGLFRLGLQVGSRQWGGSNWELDLSTGVFNADLGCHDGDLSWELRRGGAPGSEMDDAIEAILEAAADAEAAATIGAGKEDLARAAGCNLQQARRLIDQLVEKGRLDVRRTNVPRADGRPYPMWRYFLPPAV